MLKPYNSKLGCMGDAVMPETVGQMLRIAAEYAPLITTVMSSVANSARSADELCHYASSIAQQWHSKGAKAEYGQQPASAQHYIYYYSWGWDSQLARWRVCQWNGKRWIWIN